MCGNNYPEEHCDVDWAKRNSQACNWWVDDCGPDAACHFVAEGETACVALAADPSEAYEPCSYEAYDCQKGLYCNGEYCMPQCSCDELRPHCAEPGLTCNGDGSVLGPAVCTTICNVLDPVCPEPNLLCYTFWWAPQCALSSVLPTRPMGEACAPGDAVACLPGTDCVEGAPQCDYPMCCSPFCALDDPDACSEFGAAFGCAELEGSFDPLCYAGIGICRERL